jgi:hypothetical protein
MAAVETKLGSNAAPGYRLVSAGAAILIGMTVPPGGRDDDKVSGRRLRGVAETGKRSGEAGNSAGNATEQVQEAEARSRDVHDNGDAGGTDTAHGYTPEHLRRAAQLEERSYRDLQRKRQKTAETRDQAVKAHYQAARLHDRQANLGWGNVVEHREQANEHRDEAAADSADTDRGQTAYRDDGSGQQQIHQRRGHDSHPDTRRKSHLARTRTSSHRTAFASPTGATATPP